MIRILAADDHAIVLAGLREIFDRADGMELVGEVMTGGEIIPAVEDATPDVLVLDISLPDKSGMEIIPSLHDIAPSTAILIYSMHSGPAFEVVRDCLFLGAKGYVLKSSPTDTLLECVAAVHGGEHFLDPVIAEATPAWLDQLDRKPRAGLLSLSPRQVEVLRLLAEGKNTKETAFEMGVSPKTVESHRKELFRRLHARTVADLVHFAVSRGLI